MTTPAAAGVPASPGGPSLPADHPVRRALAGWLAAGYVPDRAPLVIACSGGADSLALAAAAQTLAPDRIAAAVVIDHGLQEGSAEVAAAAARQLRRLGYRQVEVRSVLVAGEGGMEAAARRARYAALADAADRVGGGAAVLLAHTADDQAETVLLGLGRGSGPRSIAGMAPWRSPWGRPLLSVRRTDTEDACALLGLEPWQDPHNADARFARVRLRREVIPLLDEVLGGGVVSALARTAELMADDLAALDRWAEEAYREASRDGALSCGALVAYPVAIRTRALRLWAQQVTKELTFQHLLRLEGVVINGHTGQAVRLPGGTDAVRRGDLLLLSTPDVR